jgi:hypothetical protein
MMPRRLVQIGLCVLGAVAGCGSEDDVPGTPPPAAFDGVYAATTDGVIHVIVFEGTRYALTGDVCGDSTCTETGTYAFDAAHDLLTLTDAKTGRARTLAAQVLAIRDPNEGQLLQPRNLVQPGEDPLARQSQLVKPVDRALIGEQQVQLLLPNPADLPALKAWCGTNIPTGHGIGSGTARINQDRFWMANCPGPLGRT